VFIFPFVALAPNIIQVKKTKAKFQSLGYKYSELEKQRRLQIQALTNVA
jgi:hypothetical protein